MGVKQMLREVDSREITEWMAFYMLEPFGQEWMQAGTIAAEVYRSFTGKKRKPQDYLPVKPPEQEQDGNLMATIFRAFAAEHNKKHGNNRKPKSGAQRRDNSAGCGLQDG